MSDRLEGWSYPVSETIPNVPGLKLLDHTFVVAPNRGPAYFNCFGGHEGKEAHALKDAAGNGDYSVANCYRDSNLLPDTAGLAVYGVYGVCHQAANRFLWSACTWWSGPSVYYAQAYSLTFAMYGTYGRPLNYPLPSVPTVIPPIDFATLYASCAATAKPFLVSVEAPPAVLTAQHKITALHQQIHAGQIKHEHNAVITQELGFWIEEHLGAHFDPRGVLAIRNDALKRAFTVATSDLKGASLAHELNFVGVALLDELETHLGGELYTKLMKLEPGQRYAFVDPALAERAGASGIKGRELPPLPA